MHEQVESNRIFNLNVKLKDPFQDKMLSLMKGPIEHFLAFPRMNKAYAEIAHMQDSRPFADKVLDQLNVAYDLSHEDLKKIRIPSGPVIVVANHPFGGIEGVILTSLLRSVRCDVKFMANYLLNSIPEMRELLISVNPFKTATSMQDNIKPLRESINWLKNGGMLVVFPAGTVSHFDFKKGTVTDPAWSTTIARIIRKTNAPVLPLFFQGTNSAAFQMAGMVHPMLRTAMLPNQLFNKDRKSIQILAGDLIPSEKLKAFTDDDDLTSYIRLRTYLLEQRNGKKRVGNIAAFIQKAKAAAEKNIIDPEREDVLVNEVKALPPSQILVENGDHLVIQASADQIPHMLREIGRLREVAFRAVGEGTGQELDLDRFDTTYLHLFIWNRKKNEIVGSYRLGRTDDILRKQGIRGLYTNTLFHYKKGFFESMGPALELGRSFIRLEYQKSYTPLLLLWKGIGKFVVDNPQYKMLFGPVSITDDYHAISKQLMVSYLKMTRYRNDLVGLVKPKKPLRTKKLRSWDVEATVSLLKDDVENISELISHIEKDGKGIPILLKQYLKLGGKIAGFNVDPAFGNVLDGLIMVDLTQTEPRILERYLGKEGVRHFSEYHASLNQERNAAG
jgi:putative hemolysin